MKKSVLFFALLALSQTLISGAQARSIRLLTPEAAKLTEIRLDQKLNTELESATVEIDRSQGTVTLTQYRRFFCPAGHVCAQVMPAPISMELPIKSIDTDGCGSTIIMAAKDQRPVDGNLNQITLIDHRSRVCEDFKKFQTEVYVTTTTSGFMGQVQSFNSYFGGEALKALSQ